MTWHDHKDEWERDRKWRHKYNSEGWCLRHLEHTVTSLDSALACSVLQEERGVFGLQGLEQSRNLSLWPIALHTLLRLTSQSKELGIWD